MSKNVIEFHDVSKKFLLGESFNSLRDTIPEFFRSKLGGKPKAPAATNEFWALQNVSFDIGKGEVVGIMGPNGAGKSTILKLLSRILFPSKGSIQINGRMAALIEVTAGFHPDLTGRENVFLNGTILGMKRKEIESKFEQIVEFSGIREFIDTPVKRYSSGMYSRLGFSVAAHMDPEILLVDEVLSVGDSTFQAKCAERMRELMNSGATIVLVSHSLSLIQTLCKRSILLNHGKILKDGHTEEVIPFYENLVIEQREKNLNKKLAAADETKVKIKSESIFEITDVEIKNGAGEVKKTFDIEDEVSITIKYFARERIERPVFKVDISRTDGILCCSAITVDNDFVIDQIKDKGSVTVHFGKIGLSSNVYLIRVSVIDRELIHSYAVRYQDVLKISSDKSLLTKDTIFMPQVRWEKK